MCEPTRLGQWDMYHLVVTNSLPWKITMLLIGKPSISIGHLYHGYVTNNRRVIQPSSIEHLAECSQQAVSTDFAEPQLKFAPPMKFVGFLSHRNRFSSCDSTSCTRTKFACPQKNVVFGWFIVIIHRNWDINYITELEKIGMSILKSIQFSPYDS